LVALFGGALIYHSLHRINEVHVSLPQTAETLRDDVKRSAMRCLGWQSAPSWDWYGMPSKIPCRNGRPRSMA
jgi:hypothetical protein